MVKSFLILMLITTQLLAGSGGSVYLCIRNDGSFCCLDQGPTTCTCCDDQETDFDNPHALATEKPSGCGCDCGTAESTRECDNNDFTEPARELVPLVSDDPCGCTHILLSYDQPSARVARMSDAPDGNQFYQYTADLDAVSVIDGVNGFRHSPARRFWPPTSPSQALMTLSWVLIQC